MLSNFYRAKKITCGNANFMEVDIIPRTKIGDEVAKGKRKRKENLSRPAQQNLNEKNARRYFNQLLNGNFTEGDLHVTFTFSNKYLPESVKEMEKEVDNFISRLRYAYKKSGIDCKYLLVTEYAFDQDERRWTKRPHFHLVVNSGLDRDELENIWSKGRGKKKEKIGLVNADRLKFDIDGTGFEALANYLMKDPKGRKRWKGSRNLKKPYQTKADYKYRASKIKKLAESSDLGLAYFLKQYPGYDITSIDYECFEETGVHVYLKLWKRRE